MVPRTMCSTVSATLATAFGIRGVSYSLSAACADVGALHRRRADLIRHGAQDVVFAGGGEELHWGMTCQFDAMGALSTHYNATPTRASRPYDVDRDGFVIGSGGGMLCSRTTNMPGRAARASTPNWSAMASPPTVPTWSRPTAKARRAACAWPGGHGRAGCRPHRLPQHARHFDAVGDIVELEAVRAAFGDDVPPLSSTKALTGHSLGAASVHEAIYSLLMLRERIHRGLRQTSKRWIRAPEVSPCCAKHARPSRCAR
jgi:3-oxoacyl-[acyl-carrier-protein] synthase-1